MAGWLVSGGACALLLGLAACKDENNPLTPDIVFPDSAVSYAAHVQPLFNQACTLAGCHDDGPHQSPLRLTSYAGVMDPQLLVVIPGDTLNSRLAMRVTGRISPQMPLNRPPLSQNQIHGLLTWIQEGARPD